MSKTYGIYFFSSTSGINGFLIKTYDNGKRNLFYEWKLTYAHWGLFRIQLMVRVNPESNRYVWVGVERIFVKTFKVKYLGIELERQKTELKTPYGRIKWSSEFGYWVKI
jgi:hypothetical protein